MKLDLLIPVYQPHDHWAEELIEHYRLFLEGLSEDIESRMIIVNDGSSKDLVNDAQLIKENYPSSIWIDNPVNMGKGYTLRNAAKHSTAELIMYTDYDFPYTRKSMLSMVDLLLNDNCDAVVGNRDDSYYKHISGRRKRISKFLKKMNSLIFRLPTSDTQCGLKAFKEKYRELFLSTETDRYLIDVEFLKKLSKSNAKVCVQLVELRKGIELSSISNLSLVKEAINYMRIMLG